MATVLVGPRCQQIKGTPDCLIPIQIDILPLLEPALDLVLSLLKGVVVHCMSCNTDMRAGVYEDTSVQLLTLSSEKEQQLGYSINFLLRETYVYSMSTTLNVTTFALPLCLANDMYVPSQINHSSVCSRTNSKKVAGHSKWWRASALLQNEVLTLGGEQRRALLKVAGISAEITIGPAEYSRPYNNL